MPPQSQEFGSGILVKLRRLAIRAADGCLLARTEVVVLTTVGFKFWITGNSGVSVSGCHSCRRELFTKTRCISLNAAFCRLVFLQLPSNQIDMAEACGSRTQTLDSQLAANDDVAASAKFQLESIGVRTDRFPAKLCLMHGGLLPCFLLVRTQPGPCTIPLSVVLIQ
jgi:hypothetical protein